METGTVQSIESEGGGVLLLHVLLPGRLLPRVREVVPDAAGSTVTFNGVRVSAADLLARIVAAPAGSVTVALGPPSVTGVTLTAAFTAPVTP